MTGQTSLNSNAHVGDRGPGPYGSGIVAITASTTLDNTHNNKTVTFSAAAGLAVTLPTATGSGWRVKLINLTTITSNTTTIKVNNTTDAFNGFQWVISDNAAAAVIGYIASAGSDDTVTFDGTTKGGYVGDMIEIEDVASGLFQVKVMSKGTGTEATCFSATV